MKTKEFEQFSEAVMGPILNGLPLKEQRRLLAFCRQLAHPRAYAWIDKKLKALDGQWKAKIKSHNN